MPRKKFNALTVRKGIRRLSLKQRRDTIRRMLFGKNAHRYPINKDGGAFNEFELNEIIVFLATTLSGNYDTSSSDRRGRGAPLPQAVSDPDESNYSLSGSGNAEDGGGDMEGDIDIDQVLRDLDSEIHGSGDGEDEQGDEIQ